VESDDIEALDDQIAALESTLVGAQSMAAAFDSELRHMQATIAETGRGLNGLSAGFGRGLRGAIDGIVFDGARLSDALNGLARSIADTVYAAALRPVTSHFGGLLAAGVNSLFGETAPFADGAGFTQGRVIPFATGGVVSGPVSFPMRGGLGLMGEAGPEAIMPLSRGPDGRLGVRAEGGGRGGNVIVNVTTPDVEGFRRSQTQIAAQIGRALSRGQRNR